MNKQIEALKIAIEGMAKAEKVFDDLGLLLIKFGVNPSDINFHKESFLAPVIQVCKKALAEAEKQEIGEAEIRQMLKDIEYYQKRVEELEQPAPMQMNQTLECPSYLHGMKSYHPAPSWQSLSDDNILKLFKPKFECEIEDFELIDFARAIEQALKELNAKK